MSKLTGKEIVDKLKNLDVSERDFYKYGLDIKKYDDWVDIEEDLDEEDLAEIKEVLEEIGTAERIEHNSPNSEWDYYERVITYFPKHDVYIETRAHYMSYVGLEFEDGLGVEVKPKQKMFTVYEELN